MRSVFEGREPVIRYANTSPLHAGERSIRGAKRPERVRGPCSAFGFDRASGVHRFPAAEGRILRSSGNWYDNGSLRWTKP